MLSRLFSIWDFAMKNIMLSYYSKTIWTFSARCANCSPRLATIYCQAVLLAAPAHHHQWPRQHHLGSRMAVLASSKRKNIRKVASWLIVSINCGLLLSVCSMARSNPSSTRFQLPLCVTLTYCNGNHYLSVNMAISFKL